MAATVTPAGWDNIAITTLCFEALPLGASVKPGFFAAGLCCTGCFEREWRTRDALGFPDFDGAWALGASYDRIVDASLVRVVSMDARLIPRVEHDSEQFSCSFGYGT